MFIKRYLIVLLTFLIIDMVWLNFVAKNFYSKQIGHLMKTDINVIAAGLFYLLFIIGLVLFVINPALEKNSWLHALLYGALFGLVSYATYDLTNFATLKDWPLLVTIVDLFWGMFLTGSVSLVSFFIARKI
jgi:uncharacterized membrane protein